MKIIASILISAGLLIGFSTFELCYVDKTFDTFHEGLTAMYKKTEAGSATHEDGAALLRFWEERKKMLENRNAFVE